MVKIGKKLRDVLYGRPPTWFDPIRLL